MRPHKEGMPVKRLDTESSCCVGVQAWISSNRDWVDRIFEKIGPSVAPLSLRHACSNVKDRRRLLWRWAELHVTPRSTPSQDRANFVVALECLGPTTLLAFCAPSAYLSACSATTFPGSLCAALNAVSLQQVAEAYLRQVCQVDVPLTIHCAAELGHCDAVWAFLVRKSSPHEYDEYGNVALHYASLTGSVPVCNLLLNARANIEARHIGCTSRSGWTPLHFAAYSGHEPVAHLLLEAGANVLSRDEWHRTPLSCVEQRGHRDHIAMLLHWWGGTDDSTVHVESQAQPKDLAKVIDPSMWPEGLFSNDIRYPSP